MSEVKKGLLYTNEHEWVKSDGGVVTVGITDHAQHALSDVVFVELPEVGVRFSKGDEVVVIESAKAAASVYAPADGELIEINESLVGDPAIVNSDCYGEGWMYKLKVSDESQLQGLMDSDAYEEFQAGEEND